jgi:hypothetical protein
MKTATVEVKDGDFVRKKRIDKLLATSAIPRPTDILKLARPGRSPQGDSLSMHASLLASLDVQSLCPHAR